MNIYYFNDLDDYDRYNPSYFLDRKNAKELIYFIAKSPYIENEESLSRKINIKNEEVKEILDGLTRINALTKNSIGAYKVNFPCFFESDVKKIIDKIGDDISILVNKVKLNVKNLNYTKEELYHILCNGVFDNYAFDYLTKYNLVTLHKINPGDRDYIIIGYEDNDFVNNYSSKLLCSNNKFKCNKVTFNSFGDTDGNRMDFFRYFRMKQMNVPTFKFFDDYMSLIKNNKEELKSRLEDVVLNNSNDFKTIELLENIGYMKDGIICVPILSNKEQTTIGESIMNSIKNDLKNIFKKIENFEITPNFNEVPIKDTLNEVWHIIFGLINEELIKQKVVACPIYIKGQGRFLKCIYIEK